MGLDGDYAERLHPRFDELLEAPLADPRPDGQGKHGVLRRHHCRHGGLLDAAAAQHRVGQRLHHDLARPLRDRLNVHLHAIGARLSDGSLS